MKYTESHKKMRRKTLILVSFLLMLYTVPMIFTSSYVLTARPAERNTNKDFLLASESWLTGWDYRKAIAINGSSGAGTNYQVEVMLNWIVGMQDDYDDIRFTDNNGVTLLDYWLEYYEPDAPIIELADYGEISDESSSPDYILTNVKDGSAFNETSATDLEIWFEVDTTVAGFEGFSYAQYLDVDSGTDVDLTAYNFDTDVFVKIDEPLPSTYDWMNGTIYDPDYWNTTHIAFSLFELSGTADFYWDYGEIAHSKIARFWVNVTDNLDTDQTIYMYYGNDAVSTTSDGDATFEFYEDWTVESMNPARWDLIDNNGATSWDDTDADHGSILKLEGGAGTNAQSYDSVYDDIAPLSLMFRANIEETLIADQRIRIGSSSPFLASFAYVDANAANLRFVVYDDDANADIQPMDAEHFGAYHTFEITRNGTHARLYIDDALDETASCDPDIISKTALYISAVDSEKDLYVDWFVARKFITTEPVFDSWGEEEEAPTTTWLLVGVATVIFPVGWDPNTQFGYDMLFIALGLIMIPFSTLYLVRGGMKNMSRDKLFIGLIILVMGLGLLIGGVMP